MQSARGGQDEGDNENSARCWGRGMKEPRHPHRNHVPHFTEEAAWREEACPPDRHERAFTVNLIFTHRCCKGRNSKEKEVLFPGPAATGDAEGRGSSGAENIRLSQQLRTEQERRITGLGEPGGALATHSVLIGRAGSHGNRGVGVGLRVR